MILWTYKLISSVRKAIAGRRYPSQLAWAVALGLLLGLIPHGNLVAVAVLLVVLVAQINHAMAALTTIAVTLVAPKFDPIFHAVGEKILTHTAIAPRMSAAWDYPLVPWTDLNNTVVMGSFAIGIVMIPVSLMITLPLFKAWSRNLVDADRRTAAEERERAAQMVRNRERRQKERTSIPSQDDPTVQSPILHTPDLPTPNHNGASRDDADLNKDADLNELVAQRLASDSQPALSATSGRVFDVRRIDEPVTNPVPAPAATRVEIPPRQPLAVASATLKQTQANVQTRTSVQTRAAQSGGQTSSVSLNDSVTTPAVQDDQQKIDEALRYLLRQLRDSHEKDVA